MAVNAQNAPGANMLPTPRLVQNVLNCMEPFAKPVNPGIVVSVMIP